MGKNIIPIESVFDIEILHYVNGRNEFGLSASQNLNKTDADVDVDFFVHRNDTYSFIILEQGNGYMSLDFQKIRLTSCDVLLMAPGQIQDDAQDENCDYWYVSIPTELIPAEYLLVFEDVIPFQKEKKMAPDTFRDLQTILFMLWRQSKKNRRDSRNLLNELLKVFVCMIANAYRLDAEHDLHTRSFQIMRDFKRMLNKEVQENKSPAYYASALNISEVYLNETSKKTTGFTAGYWIRTRIIVEAKRLLSYSRLNSKEIAYALGYENHTYFNRLFKRETGMTPLEFRENLKKCNHH